MHQAHYFAGQFWNGPVDVSPYEGNTPVMITPADGEARVFIGNLYPHTWDVSKVPCLHARSSQGGTLGEFGDVNDPVIEDHTIASIWWPVCLIPNSNILNLKLFKLYRLIICVNHLIIGDSAFIVAKSFSAIAAPKYACVYYLTICVMSILIISIIITTQ